MPSDYDFWLKGNSEVIRYQCIEVTHFAWLKAYRYVRNHADGISVTHEDGKQYTYAYYPVTVKKSKTDENLDQSITIGVGDLGEEIPQEIDRLRASKAYRLIKPVLNYREYLSTDLTTPVLSVLNLDVTDYQPQKQGAVFICKARQLNLTKTGLVYNFDDMPSLRAFV